MNVVDELVENNRAFAASRPDRHLDVRPSRALAVVTCMDSRLDVFSALGLRDGEAHILRNAGGVITDDVIRSLAVSQRRLGTREVMLIHHTDCGMLTFKDEDLRRKIADEVGHKPRFTFESFSDLAQDVRESIDRITSSPYIPHRDKVRGFIFDVATGKLNEVK